MKAINDYKNILIFNPSFLGDTVLTTPLIKAVKKLYPNARISFCVRDRQAELFNGLPFIDNVITYDKRGADKGISGLLNFSNKLKNYNFDLVINVHKSIRSSVLLLRLGADIVGFKQAVLSSLFKHTVSRDMELHEVLRNLMLIKPLVDTFDIDDVIKLAGSLSCYIDDELYNNTKYYYSTVTKQKKVIAIAPGSVWATKRYPAEYYVEVANKLVDMGYDIALFGSKEDRQSLDEFKSLFTGDYYDYAEKTSLSDLPAFLANSSALICNDSGTMHIAVACNVPCVSIFGATTTYLGFAPYDDKSVVVENTSLDCRPCGKHGGKTCPQKHFKCMLDVKPSKVVDAVVTILGDK